LDRVMGRLPPKRSAAGKLVVAAVWKQCEIDLTA
jgi:hypothetical protein